jgi:hypothetical protein
MRDRAIGGITDDRVLLARHEVPHADLAVLAHARERMAVSAEGKNSCATLREGIAVL